MITEDYVSFETAKLLKEKKFNYPCRAIYSPKGIVRHYLKEEVYAHHLKGHKKLCPTLQMAMKWLREVHGLFISIGNDDLDYNWQIFDVKNRTKDLDPYCLTDSYGGHRKFEQACEVAINYCLKHLI